MKNIKHTLCVGKNTANKDLKNKKSVGYSSLGLDNGGEGKKVIADTGGDSLRHDRECIRPSCKGNGNLQDKQGESIED